MPLDSTLTSSSDLLPEWTATWWKGHEADLLAALEVASMAAPHLREFARFLLPRLPRRVQASSTIKGGGPRASSRSMPLAEALAHQWMAFNAPGYVNCETADIDHANWKHRLHELVTRGGLPIPMAAVQSPWKGSVHLVWVYKEPFSRRSRAQMRMRRGIKRGLVVAFDACPRFANVLQKNPFYIAPVLVEAEDGPCGDPEGWAAYQAAATGLTYHTSVMRLEPVPGGALLMPLLDVATEHGLMLLSPKLDGRENTRRHIPLALPNASREDDPRGSRLFHASARLVRRACTGDAEQILRFVERSALSLGSPADHRAMEGIARSIAAWMQAEWWGPLDGKPGKRGGGKVRQVDHGVMTSEAADRGKGGLDAWRMLSTTERRQAAAERSNTLQTSRTDTAIREGIAALVRDGCKLTQTGLAAKSGLSRRTIVNRWRSLDLREGGENEGSAEDAQDGLISLGGSSAPPPSCPLLTPAVMAKEVADAFRDRRAADRTAIRFYKAQASRLLLHGAALEPVLPVERDASAPVRVAQEEAVRAASDLQRRIAARRQAECSKIRREARTAWHNENLGNDAAWRKRLSEIEGRRDKAMEELARRPQKLEECFLSFSAVIRAEHRAWRQARGESEPQRVINGSRPRTLVMWGPDAIDLAVPW